MGNSRERSEIAAQYDVNSLIFGKLVEGLVFFVAGVAGSVTFFVSFITKFTIESEVNFFGFFPELIVIGIVLLLTSFYILSEGISTIQQSGLTPFWKCSDKRVRRFYLKFGGSKTILVTMALYDLEPDVRDLALHKLDADTVIETYSKVKKTDPYLYVEKIEAMIIARKKEVEEARIAERTGHLSIDRQKQLEEILRGNPTRTSAGIIIKELSDCDAISGLISNPHIKPWLKEMLEERQGEC